MSEEWKDWNDYYQVSSKGRVWSKKRNRFLKLSPDGKGYPQFDFRGKFYRVHRLVADLFLCNPDNKSQVNHKNGNKCDNRVENLEWVTPAENSKHAHATGLKNHKGENHPKAKLTSEDVKNIKRDLVDAYKGQRKHLANKYNVSEVAIYDIAVGKRWTHITL
jgi:hypothetical protein